MFESKGDHGVYWHYEEVASERGFGFIEAPDGKEYFFHRRGMDASVNLDSLMGSEKVIFEIASMSSCSCT